MTSASASRSWSTSTNPDRAIGQIARVLRCGGLLVLGVPIFPPGVRAVRGGAAALMERCLGVRRPHVQSFTAASIADLVRSGGCFRIERRQGFRFFSVGSRPILGALEDSYRWYRLNRWLGRRVPGLCTEVQIIAVRTDAHPGPVPPAPRPTARHKAVPQAR